MLSSNERAAFDDAHRLIELAYRRALLAANCVPGPVPDDVRQTFAHCVQMIMGALVRYSAQAPRCSQAFVRNAYGLGELAQHMIEYFPDGSTCPPVDWDAADPRTSLFAQIVEKIGEMIYAKNLQTCLDYGVVELLAEEHATDRAQLGGRVRALALASLGGLRDCIDWSVDTETWT